MIHFEFDGGPKDGAVVVHDGCSAQAMAYAELTDDGRLGAVLWCTTEYFLDVAEHLSESALRDLAECGVPLRGHLYEACVRWYGCPGVRVRMRHLGVCPSHTDRKAAVDQDRDRILGNC